MSIISPQEKADLFAKLGNLGEEKVRENLAQKIYGSSNKPLVVEWLRKQEEIRNQESSESEFLIKREEISEAKEANRLASEANAVALSASLEASASTRIARHNRNIAIAALIISIASAIISLCKK